MEFKKNNQVLSLLIIFLWGLFCRIYSHLLDPVVNPDGRWYIQQAKALYLGKFHLVTACYPYLSPYPIFIFMVYPLTHNWILSGVMVSVVFSMLSFIPLYFLLKSFFDYKTLFLTLFIFACMPPFITYSHKVIRDPVFWFFSLSGFYFFTIYFNNKNWHSLLFSIICFIIGAWTRVEGCIYLLICLIFLLKTIKYDKKFFIILVIAFFIFFTFIYFISLYLDISILKIFPYKKIIDPINYTIQNYKELREFLKKFEDVDTGGKFHHFFYDTKDILWWIALGGLLLKIIRTMYLHIFIIFCIGIYSVKDKIKDEIIISFYFFNLIGAFLVLYIQTLYSWAIATRYMALFIFPSFIFIGYGVKAIIRFFDMKAKKNLKYSTIIFLLFILISTFPKIFLIHRNQDSLIYREIGQYIAKIEKYKRVVTVGGSIKRLPIIFFYANLNYPSVTCFPTTCFLYEKKLKPDLILKRNIDYYVWDEKGSNRISLDLIKNSRHFQELKRWRSKKSGTLILFKLLK